MSLLIRRFLVTFDLDTSIYLTEGRTFRIPLFLYKTHFKMNRAIRKAIT